MKVVLFCHSLLSDWNHGNAHFLRGVLSDLRARGARTVSYEPRNAWSVQNLEADRGHLPIDELARTYPLLGIASGGVVRYDPDHLDVDQALDGADLVLVHEWNDPALVARIGRASARGGRFTLLFHDTHHRAVTAPHEMARFDLDGYDGVLAFGQALARVYVRMGWGRRVFVWHEAADLRVFRPRPAPATRRDLCWVGNWGDEERTAELETFLLGPVERLGLAATIHGVRYPEPAKERLARSGITYGGWVANYAVPEVFAAHRVTVHVPRRPYTEALPGIPTIRPFEALACGIPLISAPWEDAENLFTPGADYLVARDGAEMEKHLRDVLGDEALARALAERGHRTVLERHTCTHRVDELLAIVAKLGSAAPAAVGVA